MSFSSEVNKYIYIILSKPVLTQVAGIDPVETGWVVDLPWFEPTMTSKNPPAESHLFSVYKRRRTAACSPLVASSSAKYQQLYMPSWLLLVCHCYCFQVVDWYWHVCCVITNNNYTYYEWENIELLTFYSSSFSVHFELFFC